MGGFSCKQCWLVGFRYWSIKYLQPTQSHAVSISTAHSVSCCFYIHAHSLPWCFCPHCPITLVLFLCLWPNKSHAVALSTAVSLMLLLCPLSTKSVAVSLSTTLSVSCFYSQFPLSLLLFLCPLPTNSRAVSLSTAHSVSCCFCVYFSHGVMLFLCPLSDV
jgi:hypothetical protein